MATMTISRSLKDQLLAHKRTTPSGCWEWTGWINKEGYGRIQWKGKKYLTHIASAMVYKNYDPDTYFTHGLQVNHLCHNRKCFNPSHYYIGTQDENMNDLVAKNSGVDLLASVPPPQSECVVPEVPTDVAEVTGELLLPDDELDALALLRQRGYALVAIHPDEMVEGLDVAGLEEWMYEAADEYQDIHVYGEDGEEEEEKEEEVDLDAD